MFNVSWSYLNLVIVQLQLKPGGGHKDAGPWNVGLEHSTATIGDSDEVSILATVTGNNKNNQNLSN